MDWIVRLVPSNGSKLNRVSKDKLRSQGRGQALVLRLDRSRIVRVLIPTAVLPLQWLENHNRHPEMRNHLDGVTLALACTHAAVAQDLIDPAHSHAWGENIGWVQFDTRSPGDLRHCSTALPQARALGSGNEGEEEVKQGLLLGEAEEETRVEDFPIDPGEIATDTCPPPGSFSACRRRISSRALSSGGDTKRRHPGALASEGQGRHSTVHWWQRKRACLPAHRPPLAAPGP